MFFCLIPRPAFRSWLPVLAALSLMSRHSLPAAEWPSGFGPEVTAAERQLAERPQPDAWFRGMTGTWHGVPGLPALRERWLSFAKTAGGPKFAVLAALISEAEGNPERALEELHALPGPDARWNEGRLLALTGREAEAVEVLSTLTAGRGLPPKTGPERAEQAGGAEAAGKAAMAGAETAAEALLALTELDCIRGNFKSALARSTAAWEARTDEEFRIRILERHLSLLVEAGGERDFLEKQVTESKASAVEAGRLTASHVMAVMAEWFTEDSRLREARLALAPKWRLPARKVIFDFGQRFPLVWRPVLEPSPEEVALTGAPPPGRELAAARLITATTGALPSPLVFPGLNQALREQPLAAARQWFPELSPLAPPPALFGQLVGILKPGAPRLALELVDRAWSGKAGPGDLETLSRIIVEAPMMGGDALPLPDQRSMLSGDGWPQEVSAPTEQVVWNLRGAAWLEQYRQRCRLEPLLTGHYPPFLLRANGGFSWSEWRPPLPADGVEELISWAWREIRSRQADTAERAAEIAGKMGTAGDRVRFAAVCRREELLLKWCQDREFVRQLPSAALMLAASEVQPDNQQSRMRTGTLEQKTASENLTHEMAKRLNLDPADFARANIMSVPIPHEAYPEHWARPVNPALARIFSGHLQDVEWREIWWKARLDAVPHPLAGLPFCPSVDRFTRLAKVCPRLLVPDPWRDPAEAVKLLLFGDETQASANPDSLVPRPPELLGALADFPTENPLKHQLRRWMELTPFSGRRPRDYPPVPFPGEPDTQDREREALKTLSLEERKFLSWDLVAVSLEKDAQLRQAALEALHARSPLAAGALPPVTPEPPSGPRAEPDFAEQVRTFVAVVRRMLADPEIQATLKPVGAFGRISFDNSSTALSQAYRSLELRQGKEVRVAEALLEIPDLLATRLAITLLREEQRPVLILKALEKFPDDPELLLAFAGGAAGKGDEAARKSAFLKALGRLKSMVPLFDNDYISWCGKAPQTNWKDAEAVDAIASFALRTGVRELPGFWISALEEIFSQPEEAAKLKDIRAAGLTLARCRRPAREGKQPYRPWMPVVDGIRLAGYPKIAEEVAEAVLAETTGSLAWSGTAPTFWRTFWFSGPDTKLNNAGESFRYAEGWQLLLLAKGNDAAALAGRLEARTAAAPGDESTALAAFLARGLAGPPITEKDLARLAPLTPAGRQRVVIHASLLLTPAQLPPSLCLEAWEGGCREEFTGAGKKEPGKWALGLELLQFLQQAGAGEAVTRLIPALLDALKAMPQFPAEDFEKAAAFVFLHGTGADQENFGSILSEKIEQLPAGFNNRNNLARLISIFEESSAMPPGLIGKVDEILQAELAGGERQYGNEVDNRRVIESLVLHPRWRPRLHQLVARNPRAWQWMAFVLAVIENGLAVPETGLEFVPEKAGEGMLKWTFQGIELPEFHNDPGIGKRPALKTLTKDMGGKFDAIVTVEERQGLGRRVVARMESIPVNGSIQLSDLPAVGRLRLQLARREAPLLTAESPLLGYNTLPVLSEGDSGEDTGGGLSDARSPGTAEKVSGLPGTAPDLAAWRVICGPAPINGASAWHIQSDDGLLPPELTLLLLDESGNICAAAPVRSADQYSQSADFAGFKGSLINQSVLSLWGGIRETSGQKEKPEPFRLLGPPKRLVLAVPVRSRGAGGERQYAQPVPLPAPKPVHLTVREWPPFPPSGGTDQGKLEIMRMWRLPGSLAGLWEFGGKPVRAAWYFQGKLNLLNLQDAQAVPVVIDLPVEPAFPVKTLSWHGETVALFSDKSPSGKKWADAPSLIIVDTAAASPGPELRKFPRGVQVERYPWRGTGGTRAFFSQAGLDAILTAEGRLLTWPKEAGPVPKMIDPRWLSSTRLISERKFGEENQNGAGYPVLDWTDGKLRLETVSEQPGFEKSSEEGITGQTWPEAGVSLDADRAVRLLGPLPFPLGSLTFLGDDRFAGIGGDGAGAVLVVLRRPPDKATPPK